MKPSSATSSESFNTSFFAHPSEWTGKTGLLALVKETIESADWPHKDSNFTLDEVQSFPTKLLMTLEIYCYAKGVYSSEHIEEAVTMDPILHGLFANTRPEAETVRKFRRRHHENIKRCLLTVFELAFKVRFGEGTGDQAPIDYCVARAFDRWFEPMCGPQPGREADERLGLAGFWDGMSMT